MASKLQPTCFAVPTCQELLQRLDSQIRKRFYQNWRNWYGRRQLRDRLSMAQARLMCMRGGAENSIDPEQPLSEQ